MSRSNGVPCMLCHNTSCNLTILQAEAQTEKYFYWGPLACVFARFVVRLLVVAQVPWVKQKGQEKDH